MSTQYKKSSEVPTSVLCERLKQLSDAVTKGSSGDHEFTMRIPAECDRDADLVMAEAARRLLAYMDWIAEKNTERDGLVDQLADATAELADLRAYKEAAEKQAPAGKITKWLNSNTAICTGEGFADASIDAEIYFKPVPDESVDRQSLIEILTSTSGQSEGVAADAILEMVRPKVANAWESSIIEAAHAVVRANQGNTGHEPSVSLLAYRIDELRAILDDADLPHARRSPVGKVTIASNNGSGHFFNVEWYEHANLKAGDELFKAPVSATRPAPCEQLCEAKAFEIEIRQLRAQVQEYERATKLSGKVNAKLMREILGKPEVNQQRCSECGPVDAGTALYCVECWDGAHSPAVAVPEEMTKMKSLELIPDVDDDYGSSLFVKGLNYFRRAVLAPSPSHSQQSARITSADQFIDGRYYWCKFTNQNAVSYGETVIWKFTQSIRDAPFLAHHPADAELFAKTEIYGPVPMPELSGDRCPSHESEHSAVCESVQTEPDRSGMYFYKNSDCAALHPQSPDCKCWYKYGTGPLSSMKCESEQGGAV